jgi:hypothetical protein
MTPETKTERLALYAELRRERFGPVGRLRRERASRRRPTDEDPAILARRLRDLMEAVDDGKA